MSDPEYGRVMLNMARKDLRALGGMVEDRHTFVDEIFGFHAQQAVEKALKAWLNAVGVEYPKIHDLEELFALLAGQGEEVPDRFTSLQILTHFAVQFGYEAFADLGADLDRHRLTEQVAELVDFVEALFTSHEAPTGGEDQS